MKKLLLMSVTCLLMLGGAYGQNSVSMKKEQVKINDQVKISYLQSGSGDITLLFLHGWCINSGYWKNQITHFSKDYSVYAMDLPGFGESTAKGRTSWTIKEYAEDVEGFIKKKGLKNVVLVGHSMSGNIMLHVAIDLPVQVIGVVGVDNFKYVGVEFSPEDTKYMTDYFEALESDFGKNAPTYSEKTLFHLSTPPEVKKAVMTDIANTDPAIGLKSLKDLMQGFQDVPKLLEKLPLKLYLINSSATSTYEEGLKKYSRNDFHIEFIGDTGHYPMVENPTVFNEALDNILASVK
ncbi:alpha/beta hydrolase [Fulvivirga sp. 29W222]|uniref:Alpha/beta hydrolase n=1 Tax=Fulvivirga marina TaxID=2494733 RepID=A0A937KCH3_9BACT|nr:alpha/beta hydrolase [Fulvivirga marina]MBL6447379.1 alpha/beta hydrolase [Fulvivirga marina]